MRRASKRSRKRWSAVREKGTHAEALIEGQQFLQAMPPKISTRLTLLDEKSTTLSANCRNPRQMDAFSQFEHQSVVAFFGFPPLSFSGGLLANDKTTTATTTNNKRTRQSTTSTGPFTRAQQQQNSKQAAALLFPCFLLT